MGLTDEQKIARDMVTQGIPTFTSEGEEDYVFISYKSDDWEKVLGKVVKHMVDTYGLRVYFDKNFDRDNDSWVMNMTNAIRTGKCRAVLAFVSKDYMVSYACFMELLTARGYSAYMDHDQDEVNKLQIFPIIVDDSRNLKDAVSSSGELVKMSNKEWSFYSELLDEALECPWVTNSVMLNKQIEYLKRKAKSVNAEQISKTAEMILSDGHERHFKDGIEGTSFYSALKESIEKCSMSVFDLDLIKKTGHAESENTVQEPKKVRTNVEAKPEVQKPDHTLPDVAGTENILGKGTSVPVPPAPEPISIPGWNRDSIRVFRKKFEMLSERYKEEWKKKYTGNTPAIEISLRIELQNCGMAQNVISGRNLKALFRDLMDLFYKNSGAAYFAPAAESCIASGNTNPLIITREFLSSRIEDQSRYNKIDNSDYLFYNSYSAKELLRAVEKQIEMYFDFLRDGGLQVTLDDVLVEYRFEDSEVRNLFAAVEAEGIKVKQPARAGTSGGEVIAFEAESYLGFMKRYKRTYQKYKDVYKAQNSGNTPAVPFKELTVYLPAEISVHGKLSCVSWKSLLQLLMDEFSETTNGEYEAYRKEEEARKGLKEPAVISSELYESGTVDSRQYQPIKSGRYYYQNWFSTQEAMNTIRKELEIYIRYMNERNGRRNDLSEVMFAYTIVRGLFTDIFSVEG